LRILLLNNRLAGGGWLQRNFPTKVQWLKLKMGDLRPMSKVLFFVSLRVSPVVPAYLLNLAAPLTPLPLLHFWLATMVGCAPHAVVTVTAGRLLLYCCLIALQCCVSGAALGALVHVSVFYAWPMQNTASSQMVDPPQLFGNF